MKKLLSCLLAVLLLIPQITFADSSPIGLQKTYDEEYLTEDAWYDAAGNLVAGPYGYARVTYEYKSLSRPGNPTLIRYYDAEGNPYQFPEGYYGEKRSYSKGNQVLQQYVDDHNRPVNTTFGYASWEQTYTSDGQPRRLRYLNANGNITNVESLGYASCIWTYSAKELQKITYYNARGKETNTAAGYSRFVRKFDKKRRVLSEGYYRKDGTLVPGDEGWSLMEYTYDQETGELLSAIRLDENQNPWVTPTPTPTPTP
ncbi:MAG: hypothetical protein Q4G19_09020, partial [Clostridia bacterium]|nr:hypothetical protein [Clostridia bacterium]